MEREVNKQKNAEEVPGNFQGFDTLYSMLNYKTLTGQMVADRYHVESFLGSGGMGDIYRAFDTKEKKVIALKRLIPPAKTKERMEMKKRFEREVTFLEAIYSPYVVEIYDSFKSGCFYYLSMEYIEGKDLASLLKETQNTDKRFSILEVVSIMAKVARGLETIHATGIVHRDIKPGNIMVNRLKDVVKILDLGLACSIDRKKSDTFSGTISFMSPEEANGKRQLGPQSDIFSLGTTFYTILTGKLPFEGEGIQCLVEICEKTPELPHKLNKEVPPSLSNVIMKTIAKNPLDRYPNAAILSQSLEDLRKELLGRFSDIVKPQSSLDFSVTRKLSYKDIYFLKQICNLRNSDWKMRKSTIKKLGRLRNSHALKPLASLLNNPEFMQQKEVLKETVIAIGKFKDMNGLEPLKQILHTTSDGDIRKLCQRTLAKILHRNYLEIFERLLDYLMIQPIQFYELKELLLQEYTKKLLG